MSKVLIMCQAVVIAPAASLGYSAACEKATARTKREGGV